MEDLDATPADQWLCAIEENEALQNCLDTLSVDQRTSIKAAFFDGLTHSELALRVSVPLGTMKSWIRRGLPTLKGVLVADDPFIEDEAHIRAGEYALGVLEGDELSEANRAMLSNARICRGRRLVEQAIWRDSGNRARLRTVGFDLASDRSKARWCAGS